MAVKHTVIKIKARQKYLAVLIEVDYAGAKRWVEVKVPWRMLNEHYEDVAGYMAHQANEDARKGADVLYLPLEKWE